MGNTESQRSLNKLQSDCGYTFRNPELLTQALTHDSMRVNDPNIKTYQRMEFLGDSIVHFIITDYLFRKWPDESEGRLTQRRSTMVSGQRQKEIANKLEVQKLVRIAEGMRQQRNGNEFKGYDKFIESVLGAIYLDAGGGSAGMEVAKKVVYKLWELTEPQQASCIIS